MANGCETIALGEDWSCLSDANVVTSAQKEEKQDIKKIVSLASHHMPCMCAYTLHQGIVLCVLM